MLFFVIGDTILSSLILSAEDLQRNFKEAEAQFKAMRWWGEVGTQATILSTKRGETELKLKRILCFFNVFSS